MQGSTLACRFMQCDVVAATGIMLLSLLHSSSIATKEASDVEAWGAGGALTVQACKARRAAWMMTEQQKPMQGLLGRKQHQPT